MWRGQGTCSWSLRQVGNQKLPGQRSVWTRLGLLQLPQRGLGVWPLNQAPQANSGIQPPCRSLGQAEGKTTKQKTQILTRVVCISSLYGFIVCSSVLLVRFLTPYTTFSNEVSSMGLNPVTALQSSLSLTPRKHLTPLTLPFLSSFLTYFLIFFSMGTIFKVFIEFVTLFIFLAKRQMRS